MKRFLPFIFIFLSLGLQAQYTTPGDGLTYSLSELVGISDGAITMEGDHYQINEEITIAVGDTLWVNTPDTVYIAPDLLITIQGAMVVDAEAVFTVICCDEFYEGIRFEDGSYGSLANATFEYGGGIRVLTADFEMEACTLQFHTTGVSTGGALGLSSGRPTITNSHFLSNEAAAISSSANIAVAPVISNCTFIGNNTGNTNRPQINLGPSGMDTTFITGNLVRGFSEHTNAGGIAFASLLGVEAHAVINDNIVRDNRYGITVQGGNIHSRIEGNVIEDNNTQDDPNLGGSGINFFSAGDNSHIVRNNEIRRNLWGITLQGNAMPNMGEIDNPEVGPGGNIFSENGNNDAIYALFNNTPNAIWAQGNCWEENNSDISIEDAENVISHVADDPELGEVTFDPLGECEDITSTQEMRFTDIATIYPNPARESFRIDSDIPIDRVIIFDMSGRQIDASDQESANFIEIQTGHFNSGIYFIQVSGPQFSATEKLVVN